MEAIKEISETIKIKNAESLSTLNDKDKLGREELMLYENVKLYIKTNKDEMIPKADAIIAKEFPDKFEKRSFLIKTNEMTAPTAYKSSEIKKQFIDMFASGIIF